MTKRSDRIAKIRELEEARGGTNVIVYVTSTRNNLDAPMALDVIPLFHKHLQGLPGKKEGRRVDVFLHSNGGDGVVPWKLVSLAREFCDEFNVLIPFRAFSAATLTCLGADNVLMHPMGMLGPTDPTVTTPYNPQNPSNPLQVLGISVEDVASYVSLVKEDVGIRHEDELVQAFKILAEKIHPLALGSVKRATSQSRMLGEKLLKLRKGGDLTQSDHDEIIEKLTSRLYYHGHPINRGEAMQDLGLRFVRKPDPRVEGLIWEVFELYSGEMKLDEEFLPFQEVFASAKLPVPAPPQLVAPGQYMPTQISVANARIGPLKTVFLESAVRTDVRTQTFDVTLRREWTGDANASLVLAGIGWTQES